MDFIDQLRAISARIPQQTEHIQTEEATKTALVMPLIQVLGYNVFDPREVNPEYIADVGIKKGEKVDYAIMRDGKVVMLFECKHWKTKLDNQHMSQLFRYFHVSPARIAVLTNGIEYRFFTDLEEKNKMDARPFLILDMLDLQENVVAELKKLSKDSFDESSIADIASELKYTREIKKFLSAQVDDPSDEFLDYLIRQVYTGRVTQSVIGDFKPIVLKALRQFINETINERLKTAFEVTPPAEPDFEPKKDESSKLDPQEEAVKTTFEELEAFYIVKGLLREVVDPRRVVARDVQSYFGVLLDDNNRKPICRLYMNGSKWYIGIFDKDRKETKNPISDIQDIYHYADQLAETILNYDQGI